MKTGSYKFFSFKNPNHRLYLCNEPQQQNDEQTAILIKTLNEVIMLINSFLEEDKIKKKFAIEMRDELERILQENGVTP